MDPETRITIPVSLNGETRDMEFVARGPLPHDQAVCGKKFLAQVGRGTKRHRSYMDAFLRGGVWKPAYTVCLLNKQARIIGFCDEQHQPTSRHHATD